MAESSLPPQPDPVECPKCGAAEDQIEVLVRTRRGLMLTCTNCSHAWSEPDYPRTDVEEDE
jgi:uncharacterized Zn finger protein